MAEKAPNKSSEDSAFRSNESGGNLDVQPSLAVGNVDLIFVSEILEVQVWKLGRKLGVGELDI